MTLLSRGAKTVAFISTLLCHLSLTPIISSAEGFQQVHSDVTLYVTDTTWNENANANFPFICEISIPNDTNLRSSDIEIVDHCEYDANEFLKLLHSGAINSKGNRLFLTYSVANNSGQESHLNINGLEIPRTFNATIGTHFEKNFIGNFEVGHADRLTLCAFLVLNGTLSSSSRSVVITLIDQGNKGLEGDQKKGHQSSNH